MPLSYDEPPQRFLLETILETQDKTLTLGLAYFIAPLQTINFHFPSQLYLALQPGHYLKNRALRDLAIEHFQCFANLAILPYFLREINL